MPAHRAFRKRLSRPHAFPIFWPTCQRDNTRSVTQALAACGVPRLHPRQTRLSPARKQHDQSPASMLREVIVAFEYRINVESRWQTREGQDLFRRVIHVT